MPSPSSASCATPRASGPGETFALAPWQAFVVGSLFGWQRADGLRRFRTAYCAVPRKNGKSTLSAGIALYLLVADGEQGAEIYSAATTRDQARIVFDEAKRMVGSSPALRRRVQVLINNLNVEASASRFMPLSSDASSMDGLNVHGAIIDELHAHKTRHVVDVLETATGARRQPLLFEITTAGYDRHSHLLRAPRLCDQAAGRHAAGRQLVRLHRLRRRGRRLDRSRGLAQGQPELRPLGQGGRSRPQGREGDRPTGCPERLPPHAPERVDRAGRALDRPCRLGRLQWSGRPRAAARAGPASAASTSRPPPTSRRSPGSSRPSRTMASGMCCRATSCPRRISASAPSATACPTISGPGRASSRRRPAMSSTTARSSSASSPIAALFQVKEIAYDPWNATHIALRLQDEGATMVEFRQGFRSMAAPTRELEKLIVSRKLAHGGNPVTRWMAANVAVAQDPAGNLKPAKDKIHRAHRRHRRPDHGDRPRHGRPGGAPARVLHVLCVKGRFPESGTKTPQIIRALDESESYRLPVSWNVAPVALCRTFNVASPMYSASQAIRDGHALGLSHSTRVLMSARTARLARLSSPASIGGTP